MNNPVQQRPEEIPTRNVARSHPAINALTGLRFFAALSVLLFHFGAGFSRQIGAPGPITLLLQNGYLGVSFFFVLSGFILTYTHQDDRVDARFLPDFYVARLARIYPAYLFALLLALPVLGAPLAPGDAASVLAMVQSWAPPHSSSGYLWMMQAWTLSVEFFFYLSFPFLLLLARNTPPTLTVAVTLLAATFIVTFGVPSIPPGVRNIPVVGGDTPVWLPVWRLAEFIYGIMLCRLIRLYPALSRSIGGSMAESVLVATILGVMATTTDMQAKGVFTVLIGILIVQLVEGRGAVTRFLSTRTMALLGGASYSMYLLQGPVHAIMSACLRHPFDRVLSPFITIGLAIAAFRYLEQPTRKLILGKYRGWRERRAAAAPA